MEETAFEKHIKYTKFYMTDANKLEYIKVVSAGIVKSLEAGDINFVKHCAIAINLMTYKNDEFILNNIDQFVNILRKARELIG